MISSLFLHSLPIYPLYLPLHLFCPHAKQQQFTNWYRALPLSCLSHYRAQWIPYRALPWSCLSHYRAQWIPYRALPWSCLSHYRAQWIPYLALPWSCLSHHRAQWMASITSDILRHESSLCLSKTNYFRDFS